MGGDFLILSHINPELKRMYEWFLLSSGNVVAIYLYALDVVGGRWLEGANIIYLYALDVIGGRWVRGSDYWGEYFGVLVGFWYFKSNML